MNQVVSTRVLKNYLEAMAWDAFQRCLDQGMTIDGAADKVARQWPHLPSEFIDWLRR